MGNSSQKRRQRRKRKAAALAPRGGTAVEPADMDVDAGSPAGAVLRVQLRMGQLELAKGHDGLLRGEPEPALLVAVYCATAEHTRLGGRYLYRFECPGGYPCKVSTREPSREACVVEVDPGARLVLLALAVEEDSGRGLQALYAALERGESIVVSASDSTVFIPLHLHECQAPALAPGLGHRVHLSFGEHDPATQTEGDGWVAAVVLHAAPEVQRGLHRLHFCSGDGRNDWTAELEVVVQRA